MHDGEKMLPEIGRQLTKIPKILSRSYRYCYPREKILGFKLRERTNRLFKAAGNRFVIFLVPGYDVVNGGVMSICSIAAETNRLLSASGVSVAVCTAYGQPRMLRYTKFDNDTQLFAFMDLLPSFPTGSEVLIHVPELWVDMFVADCRSIYLSRSDLYWRFNILLQRDAVPTTASVDVLKKIGPTTVTLAYEALADDAAQRLGCPVHFLSWYIAPEDFQRRGYSTKDKLIIISPDHHPARDQIIARISHAISDHKVVEIRNMTYEKYKSVIKDAKFAFTFGEGLDGYFVETIFCGGVGMAIFDEHYFTPEFRDLDGIFRDGDDAVKRVEAFLSSADNERCYQAIAQRQYELCAKTFDRNEYLGYIKNFYEVFFPEWKTAA